MTRRTILIDPLADAEIPSRFWMKRRASAILLRRLKTYVERELRKLSFEDAEPEIRAGAKYALLLGGKRLRPILMILVHKALGGKEDQILPFALSSELAHNASLIIDDIMDAGELRRGKPSVYVKFGKVHALLCADYLIYKAVKLILDCEVAEQKKNEIARLVCDGFTNTIEGQWTELETENNPVLTLDHYMEIVWKKTSQLFVLGGMLSAIVANAKPEIADAMQRMGRRIGILFQMRDDILDYIGDKRFGKRRYIDLEQGKRTAPIVIAMTNTPEIRKVLCELLDRKPKTEEDKARIVSILRTTGALRTARKLAAKLAVFAKNDLACLPHSNERTAIIDLIDYVSLRVT